MFGLLNLFKSNKTSNLVSVTNVNGQFYRSRYIFDLATYKVTKFSPLESKGNRMFVVSFVGDTNASQVKALSQEISSILYNYREGDQVLVRIESPGGAAHAYGYAASQLMRLKNAKIPLTVSVDKVAASGGYLMACVADKIISAPWAIIGSIGVVSEVPNVFNLLKNLGIDYRQYTAGEFKRTISMMGPITDAGETKYISGLMEVYEQFKNHVIESRPSIKDNIDLIATGEHWSGIRALDLMLVDEIKTSDDFIFESIESFEVLEVKFAGDRKPSLMKVISDGVSSGIQMAVSKLIDNAINHSYKLK